jgi:NADPH2:quinone reductase
MASPSCALSRSPASGGPEVLDVVDLPDPAPGPGRQLYEVTAGGVNFAGSHHREY